jgi:hypothetical protein
MFDYKRQTCSVLMPISLVIILCSFLEALDTRAQARYVEARVLTLSGNVQLFSSSHSGNITPVPKYRLEPGDEIVTGDNGRVVILLTDGSQVIVFPKSRVKLKEFRSANSARELLDILVGRVRVTIRHAGSSPNPYRLNSPAASIAVRGTDFMVDVLGSGETTVFVYEGLVEVTSLINPDNKRLVAPGDRVIVRPGGDISMAFPGPGGELNGKSRMWKDVSQIYQQSVNSLVQNSTEISPSVFTAFPNPHMDSLENPAYAAEFTTAQGRITLLPSVRQSESIIVKLGLESIPDIQQGEYPRPRFDYSVSPLLSFFTPVPGTRLVLGAGISAVRSNLSDLNRYEYSVPRSNFPGLPQEENSIEMHHSDDKFNIADMYQLNLSMIAAYSLGSESRTSFGIGLDHLSGNGSLHLTMHRTIGENNLNNLIFSKTRLARTRLSFGFGHKFSGGRKLGLYIQKGQSSSAQDYEQRLIATSGFPSIDNYLLPKDKVFISSDSFQIGARWRAPLTRGIYYGVEGSFLHEKILSPATPPNKSFEQERDEARRARIGAGLGFALKRATVINLDLTGGYYKTTKPQIDLGILSIPYSYLTPELRLDHEGGPYLSTHVTLQTKLWRNSFASASYLMTIHRNNHNYLDNPFFYERGTNKFTTLGAGWKFKPNLIAEYLISLDHTPYSQRRRIPSHSLMLRYTFDLKITNER